MPVKDEDLLWRRAKHVQDFVNSNSSKGISVKKSVETLANNILFLSTRQIYKDLQQDLSSKNKY